MGMETVSKFDAESSEKKSGFVAEIVNWSTCNFVAQFCSYLPYCLILSYLINFSLQIIPVRLLHAPS